MLYVKAVAGSIVSYPYTQTDLVRDNPATSFPSGGLSPAQLAGWDVYPVHFSPVPEYDSITQYAEEIPPAYDGSSWIQQWSVVDLSQAEIEAKTEAQAALVRADRNARLAACDWTQVDDAPFDNVTKAGWAAYRQALRDISGQAGFPWEVEWPQEPG
jgi:hypothetical protein